MPNDPMIGRRFVRLLVLEKSDSSKSGHKKYKCICDCGNIRTVFASALYSGNTKSCGCLNEELRTARNTKHGMRHTRLYAIWLNMKERCYNQKHRYFMHYGGKGIEICDEWRDDFLCFHEWAVKNGYADNLTIDRIDGNKNYSPENCRWITMKEQQNNRRNNFNVEIDGETKNLTQWAAISGVNRATLYSRYQKGVRGADLLKKPRRKRNAE